MGSIISQFYDKSGMEGQPFFYGVGGTGGALWHKNSEFFSRQSDKMIFANGDSSKNCICSLGPLSILSCQCPAVLGISMGWSRAGKVFYGAGQRARRGGAAFFPHREGPNRAGRPTVHP